jgi:hypothetical protein
MIGNAVSTMIVVVVVVVIEFIVALRSLWRLMSIALCMTTGHRFSDYDYDYDSDNANDHDNDYIRV